MPTDPAWQAAVREGAEPIFTICSDANADPSRAAEAVIRTALATLERHGCGDMTVSQVLAGARPLSGDRTMISDEMARDLVERAYREGYNAAEARVQLRGPTVDGYTGWEGSMARIALARALSAALPVPAPSGEVDGWQPIETAPRDQRAILATHIENAARTMHVTWRDAVGSVTYLNPRNDASWSPTHWMPLPPHPATIPAPLPRVAEVAGEVEAP